ncbi:MAG: hypothetical protein M2R45_02231 [Verrucomicrobia subdivision 3 bacterium]|nr:hypothetical protein [Limisphaerales bacterium]MCS1413984.1 hypothetical protein [Limisphaerales bacterium]
MPMGDRSFTIIKLDEREWWNLMWSQGGKLLRSIGKVVAEDVSGVGADEECVCV